MKKKFLKKWLKISLIIWFVQWIITTLLRFVAHDYYFRGLPFKYLEGGGNCLEGPCDLDLGNCVSGPCGTDFYPIFLLLNIVIWLLLGLGITYLINKNKN